MSKSLDQFASAFWAVKKIEGILYFSIFGIRATPSAHQVISFPHNAGMETKPAF